MDDLKENRFTVPTGFCPHPEYWHSPDSEATEIEVSQFIGALVRMIKPSFVLETGTYHGHTSLEIGLALKENGFGVLVSIEKDPATNQIAYKMLRDKEDEVGGIPITLLNQSTLDYTPFDTIDFGFFDSWQEGRHEEFLRYHNQGFIKPGAIVAFHDSAPHHQVYKLVKEHLIDHGYISTIQFHTPRGLLLGQVLK